MTPPRAARLAAGYSARQAASVAFISPSHLESCERRNRWSWRVAATLAALYGCDVGLFRPRDDAPAGPRRKAKSHV